MKMKLLETFTQEIKEFKYFNYCRFYTPDISHQDQLTFVLRYVNGNNVIERFLGYIPLERHTTEYLTEVVMKKLNELELDIDNC